MLTVSIFMSLLTLKGLAKGINDILVIELKRNVSNTIDKYWMYKNECILMLRYTVNGNWANDKLLALAPVVLQMPCFSMNM